MRRQAGTHAALAAALCGMLPTLFKANILLFSLTSASIAVLLFSALILILHDKFSSRIWKWLVTRAYSVEVEYASAGLGLASTGLSLLQPPWIWLGIPMFLLGGFFIGGQIGKGINTLIKSKKAKPRQ